MPEDNILSEEEMTDLAGRGERDESDSRQQLYQGGEVLLYDFKQPEHTKQSHFPTLQIINEKTLSGFRHKLETMLQQNVEAGVQEIHINESKSMKREYGNFPFLHDVILKQNRIVIFILFSLVNKHL